MPEKLKKFYYQLLSIPKFRYLVCSLRWKLLKNKTVFYVGSDLTQVNADVVKYNFSAFDQSGAAFGCGGRMALLLNPISALLINQSKAKVLIVGPRTEDDIFWARSLGLLNTTGLDLFSYSPYIDVGDIHQTDYSDHSFDAIILGWIVRYSQVPEKIIEECKRIIKPGGFLSIGMEAVSKDQSNPAWGNLINSSQELISLVNKEVVFKYDPEVPLPHDIGITFKV
jgi:SAM-dependent methyltransferase